MIILQAEKISYIFALCALLFFMGTGVHAKRDPGCYKNDEIEHSTVAAFKDNYIPVEYKPEPKFFMYTDAALLALMLITATVLVIRKKGKFSIYVLTVAAFLYFGLFRGGCICPVGSTSNVVMGIINPLMVGRTTAVIFLLPLIAALIAGRVFCSAGCPLGAVQQIFYRKKKFLRIPRWTKYAAFATTAAVLLMTVFAAAFKQHFFVCMLDPYKTMFFTAFVWVKQGIAYLSGSSTEYLFFWACSLGAWIILAAALLLGFFVPRPFCRFICPYGVILGLLSLISFRQRRIDTDACVFCGRCEKSCPVQAIEMNRTEKQITLSNYQCVECDQCRKVCGRNAIN